MDTTVKEKRGILKLSVLFAFLFKVFLCPSAINEDDRRRELIATIILFSSFIFIFGMDCSLLYNSLAQGTSYDGISFVVFSAVALIFLFMYALSRKGYFTLASYLLIIFYLAAAGYGNYLWGVSLPSSILIYALSILIASILIGSGFGFVIGLCACISLNILGTKELIEGILPAWKLHPATFSDVNVYAFILFVVAFVSWLSNRETEKSLFRARMSEKALAAEKELFEIKVMERTNELQKVQAERIVELYRLAEFGKLSSGLFHDLINPLSAVALNIQGINNDFHPDVIEIKTHLSLVISASKKMSSFISALRKHINSSSLKSLFSCNKAIEEALMLFSYRASRLKILMMFNADENVELYGNEILFHHIISNFISNALDACEEHGLSQRNSVNILLSTQKESIIFKIKDTGGGIKEETLSKIFDPFFTTKTHNKGMGIGLSTSNKLITEEFFGTIRVETKLGKGTAFIITIPRDQQLQQSISNINDAY